MTTTPPPFEDARRPPTTEIAVERRPEPRPVALPGLLLGVGLGGFVDGIVLHQILQWHNMLSAVLPPTTVRAMHVNMVFDGYFHAGVWAATLLGVLLLWGAGRRGRPFPSFSRFLGQLLFGWGLFNLVEGVVDHHVLQLHHVVDVPHHEPLFDWLFLGLGALQLLLGAAMLRARRR